MFKEKLAFLIKQKVEEFKRTKRKSSFNIDLLNVDAVDKSVETYVGAHPTRNMSDIA